ncbi:MULTISPECIES: 4-(cytidine 5'-diphospho)-2-C-methyl-D-erythritol kinase [unclassified Roseitalea]|nr:MULTISPECIES: 4-(cytidine 5'-diphospho)-2-C-methyl-D-erythritol kinase [unclassified Roseitalea]
MTDGAERSAIAPAKINLCLHVTGRRADGYHLIDSLVVFADGAAADRLTLTPAESDRLAIDGPFSGPLRHDGLADNLVARARDWLRARIEAEGGAAAPVALALDKRLPVASGIGGGSADAAAALRLLAAHWAFPCATLGDATAEIATALGADVPMCLAGQPAIARGIGDDLSPVTGLPALPAVLVNPGIAVSTRAVFAGLAQPGNAPLPAMPTKVDSAPTLARWLARSTRNDLQAPASERATPIGDCLAALARSGAMLARMSGSGATCFGLYGSPSEAATAARAIALAEPGWWVQVSELNRPTARSGANPT